MAIFDPPQNPHPLTIIKKLLLVITSATPTAVPNLVQIRPWGVLGKWLKYNEIFKIYLYLFFMNSPTGQTRRWIFMLDGSNDADSRKDVPFGVLLTLLDILGVKSPENHNFWGVNRRFQAKRAKY